MQLKFSAKIDSIGVNPYVFLPPHILKQLFLEAKKEKGAIQVKGRINHKEFIQTLVKYRGKWRLYINGIMRKEAQVSVGDQITIVIEFDPAIREVPMHELL